MVKEDCICQVCGAETPDIRHIKIECFYELGEVSDKLKKVEDGYIIQVCKGCRAVFLFGYLKDFIENGGKKRKEAGIDEEGISEYTPLP